MFHHPQLKIQSFDHKTKHFKYHMILLRHIIDKYRVTADIYMHCMQVASFKVIKISLIYKFSEYFLAI